MLCLVKLTKTMNIAGGTKAGPSSKGEFTIGSNGLIIAHVISRGGKSVEKD